MMDLRNCSRCGKLFVYITQRVCPACVAEDEKEFEIVREYVWEHRGCSAIEVHEATGVSMDKILQFLREGRLEAQYLGEALLFCETCGDQIDQGRFCSKCADNLVKGFKGQQMPKEPAYKKTGKTTKSERMFLADRIRKR